MTKLTPEEVKAHHLKIRHIRDRSIRATMRYTEGDITKKKWLKIKEEVKQEEIDYVKTSGVILYFGNLFKVTQ